MAPAEEFWRFMDEVHEMTFPMASIDWCENPAGEKEEPGSGKGLFAADAQSATENIESNDEGESMGQGVKDDIGGRDGRGQMDEIRQENALILGAGKLTEAGKPAKGNNYRLFEDLNNQNKELLQEKKNAVKWQDAASMAIKEAREEAETCMQEVKTAKKTGRRAAATLQRQLDDVKSEVEVLKRDKALVAEEKIKAEAERRGDMLVAKRRIEELQTGLNSAIANAGESIERFDEPSRASKEMQKELTVKNQKLAAKDGEIKVLQDRIYARDSAIQAISIEAGKDREACNKYCREKFESEKAQRNAELRVGDLEREAITVKAKMEEAMKALQTKLDESVVRETRAKTRVTEAEGDAEQLKRELDNTESARQSFEKKEGEWAALFAANQAYAGDPSQSTLIGANAPISKTDHQIHPMTASKVEVSKLAEELPEKNGERLEKPEQQVPGSGPDPQEKIKELEGVVKDWERAWKVAENGAEDWKREICHELDEKNQTLLATERQTIRRKLDEEKQTALAAERRIVRGNAKRTSRVRLMMKLKAQKNKEQQRLRRRVVAEEEKRVKGKKAHVKWSLSKAQSKPIDIDRSQLEVQIRTQLQWSLSKAQSKPIDIDRSQLEVQIRTQLQTEYQSELSIFKTQWEVEHAGVVRSQLEVQIRNQLQTQYQKELSNFKTQWEVEHSPSQTELESQENTDSGSKVKVDEIEGTGSATARSAEDDMLLASLSRESDETHELFQEIGRIGLPRDTSAWTVLRELNQAKDALYDVKCELRNSDAVVNKNNLLYSVGRLHINEHYIQKLNPATREVLVRQANEANRRLEYVQKILGTNDDVPKDAMLESLLEPLKTETSRKQKSAPPQDFDGSGNASSPRASASTRKLNVVGNVPTPGTLAFSPVNGFGNSAAAGTSSFSPVNYYGNSTAPGTFTFPRPIDSFDNAASPRTPETNQKPSSTPLKVLGSFGDTAAPPTSKTLTKGVFNPFEDSHFAGQSGVTRPSQNDQDIEASDEMTEAKKSHETKLRKTFGPFIPQGRGPATPPSVNVAAGPEPIFNLDKFPITAPTNSSNQDQEMDTDGDKSPLPATPDHRGIIGMGSVSSRPRQAKKSQVQQGGFAPKGRQLAHQAFAKRQNVLMPLPTQAQQANRQGQTTQQVGSVAFPPTKFTLEPNHGFDFTPSTPHIEHSSHLRVQHDPAESQMPLKIFHIPDEAPSALEPGQAIAMLKEGKSADEPLLSELMPPQVEDDEFKAPPGCGGWTRDMENHARDFLKGADIEQVQVELYSLYPSAEHMAGLTRYLEKLRQEIEDQEPDQVQNQQSSEQPARWTNEMTAFVEGSLCAGNDVKATVNLFRLEKTEAFDIQALEEQVEKLKNEYFNKKTNIQVQQDRVPRKPLEWTDNMTAIIYGYLRNGDRNIDLMVQSLEVVDENALWVEGMHEYVAKLTLDFEAQAQDQANQD